MILALVLALTSPSTIEKPDSRCVLAITNQKGSNALDLGNGYKACEKEGREDDAALLSVLGRIRASADMILIPPEDLHELSGRREFGAIFANGNKFVDEKIARDPERFATLVNRVLQADLSIPANYHPGWAIGNGEKRLLYAEVIDGLRTDTLAMERYIAKLVRDEAYFMAYRERVAMLSELPKDGAQLPERFGEVTKIMQARIDVLGDPPTKTAVPWRKVYKPGPNVPFTVLHRGFNGPAKSEEILFRSPTEVKQSWIRDALTEDELSQVLSRIDFESELLGLYAVGKMSNATENLFVTEFDRNEDFDGYSLAVRVGVAGEDCGYELSPSYPFVLVKTSSQGEGGLSSKSRANYPDQCAPVMAGKPISVVDPD
ncbi:hypothetical protein [Parasphingorhabdus sp.]|uniref:hypothetical protein n=1 Tax=Parasphingorhabdus sp. TaxID=2709688 RepID=UPI003D2E7882